MSLTIGDDFLLWSKEATTLLAGSGKIVIGDRVFINFGALIFAQNRVEIGDDVAIGIQAVVADSNMHGQEGRPVRHEVTTIGSGSWIGMRAMVLAGVHLGTGCIVAAGAVVTKDFPDDSIVAGVPAKMIRRLEHQEGVHKAWNNKWDPDFWDDGGRASR